MDDLDSITPQDAQYILMIYCERFYPAAMEQVVEAVKTTTQENIKRMIHTPLMIKTILEGTGHTPTFSLPFISSMQVQRADEIKTKAPETQTITHENLKDPLQIMNIDIKKYKTMTTKTKRDLIISNIQSLLKDNTDSTQTLRALDIIKNLTTDEINDIMTPQGLKEFTQGLHSKPTTYKHGTQSHGSNLEYDYLLKIYHSSAGKKDIGWENIPGPILQEYLSTLGDMLGAYNHTAILNPSPSDKHYTELKQYPCTALPTKESQRICLQDTRTTYNTHHQITSSLMRYT